MHENIFDEQSLGVYLQATGYIHIFSYFVEKFEVKNKQVIEASYKDKKTPLHDEAKEGDTAFAAFLLENGAKIEAENSQGSTPLIAAMHNKHKETAALLEQEIEKRAE